MKIITKFFLNAIFLIVMILIIITVNIYLMVRTHGISQKSADIGTIVSQAIDIALTTNDYLYNRSERTNTRWNLIHKALADSLEELDFDDKSAQNLMRKIKRNHSDLKNIFSLLTTEELSENFDHELQQRLVSQLSSRAKNIVSSSEQLDSLVHKMWKQVEKMSNLAALVLILFISLAIITNIILISKSFTGPILTIHKGTTIIGEGNLDYNITVNTKDELSELADSINRMTDNLGKITVSSQKLEKEVEERKEIEKELKKSLKEKGILISEIHHRVKNNMQLIISMFNLQQEQLEPAAREILKTISSRVRMFGSIYRKLYQQEDFSKIDFVKHLKDNLPDLVKAYNVADMDISLNVKISAPFFTLEKAIPCGLLLNELISNSLKHAFTDRGSIDITIVHNSDGDIEHITYQDSGRGAGQLKEGFGSKIITALAHQLNLTCQQSTRGGMRYDFYSKKQKALHCKKSGSILFVEDEIIIAFERVDYLKSEGFVIDENILVSGDDAVNYVLCALKKPILILMDIGLQGEINGIEAAQEIRAHNPEIPIIFMSGYDDEKTKKLIANIPKTDFLNKICSNEEMKLKIENFINR